MVDDNTIKVSKDGRSETLRLIGIDTPEVVDPRKPVQYFGKEASARTKELLSDEGEQLWTLNHTEDSRCGKSMVPNGKLHSSWYGANLKGCRQERVYLHPPSGIDQDEDQEAAA